MYIIYGMPTTGKSTLEKELTKKGYVTLDNDTINLNERGSVLTTTEWQSMTPEQRDSHDRQLKAEIQRFAQENPKGVFLTNLWHDDYIEFLEDLTEPGDAIGFVRADATDLWQLFNDRGGTNLELEVAQQWVADFGDRAEIGRTIKIPIYRLGPGDYMASHPAIFKLFPEMGRTTDQQPVLEWEGDDDGIG